MVSKFTVAEQKPLAPRPGWAAAIAFPAPARYRPPSGRKA